MANIDKHYLRLQYWNKVLRKNGTEFQSFFEDLMALRYPVAFIKIKPYGKEGDQKNDGFRKDEGIYYQVYAPESPYEKQATAVNKMLTDFKGLYEYWHNPLPIKEFHFVFNDKDSGLAPQFLTEAVATLQSAYPDIKFNVLTPQQLESEFFKLPDDDKVSLGFSIDKTTMVALVNDFLVDVERDLDRSCLNLSLKSLEKLKDTIASLGNEDVTLEYGLLKAKALRNLDSSEARIKYESLTKLYPADPRPLLYLAELELDSENPDKNLALLQEAEKIDPDYWLLRLEKIVRDIRLRNAIDISAVNEATFPSGNREKSTFYRLYAICYERNKNHKKADQFIEKAIQLNPDRLSNYQTKLSFLNSRLSGKKVYEVPEVQKLEILNSVNQVISKFESWGSDSLKEKISLLLNKIDPLAALGKFVELEQILNELFSICMQCNFDLIVEEAFLKLLSGQFPDNDFVKLLDYLSKDSIVLSNYLMKTLVYQFLMRGEILKGGKEFFKQKRATKALDFIKSLEEKSIQGVLNFIDGDLTYKQGLAMALKDFPDLRLELLNELERADITNKEMIWMLFYYQSGENQKAYEMLAKVKISHLIAPQCEMCADIAKKADDGEKELEILNRWLLLEENEKNILRIKLAQFSANANLGKLAEVISIGETLLANALLAKVMDKENREMLLAQTIIAHIKRSQFEKGLELLKKYSKIPYTFNFKSHIQAELYFVCGDTDSAIKSVIEGVKQLKNPNEEQYGSLFGHLIQIPEKDGFSLNSDEVVEDSSFVKLRGEEKWYYLGEDNPLDAFSISKGDKRYDTLIGKKIGDNLQFPNDKYANVEERVIEYILPLERYVFWKARDSFEKLAKSGSPLGQLIHVPEKDGKPDLSNIIAFMADLHKSDKEFYESYCTQAFPIALLAYQQGGLINAIGKIAQERRGFIRLSNGTDIENTKQAQVANKILAGSDVYLDAISALFLAETGLLKKIKPHVPNLKVPQSVINFLFDTIEKFRITPGSTGRMGYADGRLTFNQIAQDQSTTIRNRIKESIELLENNKDAIEAVPHAKKADVWSEAQIPAELSDACMLAQEKNALVLTDDYLYLHVNALETKKDIPEYCSTLILIKTLLDKGLISFEDYLNYFSYLASYRCRFLGLSVDDLIKSVFGDGGLIVFQPENLRKFNLPLVLSEEYGVPLNTALGVVVQFLAKIIGDDSITIEAASNIFSETVPKFLEGRVSDKGNATTLLSPLCRKQIEIWKTKARIAIPMELADDKLNRLDDQINLFTSGTLIL